MADNLDDLGGFEVFDWTADYTVVPSETREIQVIANEYSGTITDTYFPRDHVKKFKFKISDLETLLFSFLVFFADRVARLQKFWLPDILNRFAPVELITGEEIDYLRVTKLANLHTHGEERVFIKLKNGDRYSRKIDTVTQETSYTKFTIDTFGGGFTVADIALCGLLYLVRFDKDVQEITYTGIVASTDAEFIELLHEYPAGD